jgi:hypothetical protein
MEFLEIEGSEGLFDAFFFDLVICLLSSFVLWGHNWGMALDLSAPKSHN